jgi:hypothetical protein
MTMTKYLLPASIIALAGAFLVGAFLYTSHLASGSVIMGGEYRPVTVISTTGTTSPKALWGTLGSVVVSKTGSAGEINFYATTSRATSSANLIMSFDGTADEGTYTYDIEFAGGLLIEEKGYDGEAVVTIR